MAGLHHSGGANMNDIETKFGKLLDDPKKLARLLLLEKERRGLGKDKLLFVGMANVAKYWWCARQIVYKSKEKELDFFVAYLQDRLMYSLRLGLVDKMPRRNMEFLEVGNRIRLRDIEKLLREMPEETEDQSSLEWIIGDEDISELEDPKHRGLVLETTRAEKYPTIRWNFRWKDYVLIGVPDGITDDFVYEFKTTRNKYLMHFATPVALTQADLYGYFFKRNKKRIQIYIIEEGKTETWEEQINKKRATKTLEYFRKVDGGWDPPPPKAKWKCKNCEFTDKCKDYTKKWQN